MRWRKHYIDGSFGDRTVLVTTGEVYRPRKAVVLFHGVHSSANGHPANKYARIGAALAENGLMPVLVETSRRVRNRHDYADRPVEWIADAFYGKNYQQELSDCYAGCCAARSLFPNLPITLWGFSLGGLSALLIASGKIFRPVEFEGLVMCGSGAEVMHSRRDIFKLPILDSLSDGAMLMEAAQNVHTSWARVFHGSLDTTFSRTSCHNLFAKLPVKDKEFYEIEGADHSFRLFNGKSSSKSLEAVYRHIPQLFPMYTGGDTE